MWTQFVLRFLIGLVVASAVGAASYLLGQWFRRAKPSWARPVDYALALLGIPVLISFVLVVVPVSIFGAYTARLYDGKRNSVFYYFVRLLSSTTLPLLLIVLVGMFVYAFLPALFTSLASSAGMWVSASPANGFLILGTEIGLLAAPSVIPISLWVWQSSKIRPGFDRPFREGDATQ